VASSRSHTILLITLVRRRGLGTNTGAAASIGASSSTSTVVSKLALVDLAGSERASSSTAAATSTFGPDKGAARFQEAVQINQSLFVLRKVITALSKKPQGPDNGRHVPYRESKLTSLLQHSIGGNSFLVMLACLSPADKHSEENLSTLQYASQAANIKNDPVINIDPKDRLIQELRSQLAAAHQYILRELSLEELPRELQELAKHPSCRSSNVRPLPATARAGPSSRCRRAISCEGSLAPLANTSSQSTTILESSEARMRATAPAERRPFTSDVGRQIARAPEASASPLNRGTSPRKAPGRHPPKATSTSKVVASPRSAFNASGEDSFADAEGRDLFSAANALLASYDGDSAVASRQPVASMRRIHSFEGGATGRSPRPHHHLAHSGLSGGLPPVAPGPSPYKAEMQLAPQPRGVPNNGGHNGRDTFEVKDSAKCRLPPSLLGATPSASGAIGGGSCGGSGPGGAGGVTTRSTTATSCGSSETANTNTVQVPVAELAAQRFAEHGLWEAVEELRQTKSELETQLGESQSRIQQLQAKVEELQTESRRMSEAAATAAIAKAGETAETATKASEIDTTVLSEENEALKKSNQALQERLDIFFCAMELEGQGKPGATDATAKQASANGIGERVERLHSQLVLEATSLRNEVAGLKKKKWVLRAVLANGGESEQRAIDQEVELLRKERAAGAGKREPNRGSPKKESTSNPLADTTAVAPDVG